MPGIRQIYRVQQRYAGGEIHEQVYEVHEYNEISPDPSKFNLEFVSFAQEPYNQQITSPPDAASGLTQAQIDALNSVTPVTTVKDGVITKEQFAKLKPLLDGDPVPVYANNAAAIAGGLTAGQFYRLPVSKNKKIEIVE